MHCFRAGMQFLSVQARQAAPFESLIHTAEQWDMVHFASSAQHDAQAALNFSFRWTHDETHWGLPEMMHENMQVCIFPTMLENSSI